MIDGNIPPLFSNQDDEQDAPAMPLLVKRITLTLFKFAIIVFFGAALLGRPANAQSPPRVVPTFQSLGLYWSPPNGSADVKCRVNYRKADSEEWHAAQELWYDERALDGRHAEYRGSIVNLDPGTHYKVQLWLEDDSRTEVFLDAVTWSETFPIAKTIFLAASSATTLTIDESGDERGYVLYTAHTDQNAEIDVQRNELFNILISENVHHIILRGLTLRNAVRHGIRISDHCRDIVIENCDIAGWGETDASGFGVNLNAAISAAYRSNDIQRLVIQNNDIHHPYGDANSWSEPRPNPDGDPCHPQGPYGIVFYNTRGNHVIRNNRFYTDEEHYFADIMGAGSNISYEGFPNKDSDIYGNTFERCWDDAVEAEGANENVRIWDNHFDHIYHPIGAIVTSIGPLYIWRNIVARSRKFGNITNSDTYGRGEFIKCGGVLQDGLWYGDGRMYIYHNTILQPESADGLFPLGCEGALVAEGKSLYNVVTRNNIFTNYKADSYTFRDNPESETDCGRNDFDYDLYTGRIKETCPEVIYQQHGIHLDFNEEIVYDTAEPGGDPAPAPGSPGHDAGKVLPNFNDGFYGVGPDMGAVESKLDTQASKLYDKFMPVSLKLLKNYPNPFNTSTHFVFQTSQWGVVGADIVDANGRAVRRISTEAHPGRNLFAWDGRDGGGRAVSSGVYFCRLRAGDAFSKVRKVVLLR